MLRSLLLASLLLSALPFRANADPRLTPDSQVAAGHALDSWKADLLRTLEISVGENRGDVRSVTIAADRATLLGALPTLQAHGVLSTAITGDDLVKTPASYSNVVALLLASYAVSNLYAVHPDIGATRWTMLLSPAPGDTAQGLREMFSFSFDRPRYETIAWDRLAFTNFPRAATGFSYNLRFTLEMSRELDGSINDD